MTVGVEGQAYAVGVFDNRHLMVGHVHVGLERIVGAGPAGVAQGVGARAVVISPLRLHNRHT